jgi:hypothetical protein
MSEQEKQSLIAYVWERIKRLYVPSLNAHLGAEYEQMLEQLRPRSMPVILWLCDDNEVDEQIEKLHFYDAISGQPPVLDHATLAAMLTIRAELKPLVGPHGELTNDWYLRANAHLRAMLAEKAG